MDIKYDTAEIRQLAKKIEKLASGVGNVGTGKLKALKNGVDPVFKGEAAEALKEELDAFRRDTVSIANGLYNVYAELLDLVKRLEEADRKAANLIKD